MFNRISWATLICALLMFSLLGCDEEQCEGYDGVYGCDEDEDCESCFDGCWSYLAEEADGGEIDWSKVEWYCDTEEEDPVMDSCGHTRKGVCKDRYKEDYFGKGIE